MQIHSEECACRASTLGVASRYCCSTKARQIQMGGQYVSQNGLFCELSMQSKWQWLRCGTNNVTIIPLCFALPCDFFILVCCVCVMWLCFFFGVLTTFCLRFRWFLVNCPHFQSNNSQNIKPQANQISVSDFWKERRRVGGGKEQSNFGH